MWPKLLHPIMSSITRIRLSLATILCLAVSLQGAGAFAQTSVDYDTTAVSRQADIKGEAFLNVTRMSFNDTATLTIRLTWDKNEFELADKSAPKPELQRLRVGALSSNVRQPDKSATSSQGRNRVSHEYVYTLIPTASGEGLVHPVRIGFLRISDSQAGSVSTSELRVSIAMPAPVDETNETDWRIVGLVLLVVFVVGGFTIAGMRRKHRVKAQEELKQRARDNIASDLRALKAATSGSKAEFFENLYGFLYTYLRDAGHISARKGDSDSLIAELRESALDEDAKRLLVKWLELSATEKFSPGRGTPGESLRVYYEVEAFVREDKL